MSALRALLTFVAPAVLCALATPALAQVSLPGTWYVLVHYKDEGTANPEQERWDDKVWVFASKGKRMRWTEYPIVVFDDEAGRFERRASGQYARILHFWEPDASQQRDIADGLQVNQRGSKKKTLRGSDAKGWSSGGSRSAASASIVTYTEVWAIEGMPGRPVFSRSDHLGGAQTDNVEGLTQYAATEVSDDGLLITGTFERDGTRHGTFRMMRSGGVGALKSKKTQSEIQRQGVERSIQSNPEAQRAAREVIDAELGKAGVELPEESVEAIAKEVIALSVAGVGEGEIGRKVEGMVVESYKAYVQTDEGRAHVRETLGKEFAENGTTLSDEQLDVATREAVAAIVEGGDVEEMKKRVNRALGAPPAR